MQKMKRPLFQAKMEWRSKAQTKEVTSQSSVPHQETDQAQDGPDFMLEVQGTSIPLTPQSSSSKRMVDRVISMERRVDFNFLAKYHFNIGLWIERMGWKRFCCLDLPMYPHLVREYYGNLKRRILELSLC